MANYYDEQLATVQSHLLKIRHLLANLKRDEAEVYHEAIASPDPVEALRELAAWRLVEPELRRALKYFEGEERRIIMQRRQAPDYVR